MDLAPIDCARWQACAGYVGQIVKSPQDCQALAVTGSRLLPVGGPKPDSDRDAARGAVGGHCSPERVSCSTASRGRT
jgi:hypothetical protein